MSRSTAVAASLALSVTALPLPDAARATEAPAAPPMADAAHGTTPFALGEIVVTASRTVPLVVGDSTLGARAMATFDRVTLADALNLLPGTSAGTTGGTRNEGLILVRGFNRFEVPLTIDGIRVYLPVDNRLDFSRFLTNDIAEVQVAKGYVSVLNGPDGMGGAINLVTSKPTRALEAELDGSLDLRREGEYGGYNLAGRIGTKHDRWYAQVSAARACTDHTDLAGGFVPTATQAAGHRGFSQSEDWRVNAKAGFTPNATDEYSINYTRQQGSKLAPLSTVDPLSAQKYWTWPAWNMDSLYLLTTTRIDDIATVKTRLYRNTFHNLLRSFDTVAETTQSKGYAFNSPYWDSAWGGSTELTLRPSSRERLSVSLQSRRDRHQEQQTAFPGAVLNPRLTDKEATYSAGLENEFQITPRLAFTAGAGYDWRHLIEAQAYGAPLGTNPAKTPSVVYGWPLHQTDTWSAQGQLVWRRDAASTIDRRDLCANDVAIDILCCGSGRALKLTARSRRHAGAGRANRMRYRFVIDMASLDAARTATWPSDRSSLQPPDRRAA